MKKHIKQLLLAILCFPLMLKAQDKLIAKNASISFFSSTPIEDIKANSNNAISALNLKNGEIIFRVKNTSFEFQKKLMQEHFNENYMESSKFPLSEFKGTIENFEKLTQVGTYFLRVSGNLTIHGVSKRYTNQIKAIVSKEGITTTCAFDVKVADHKIKIPSIVGQNIAESINVKVQAVYTSP